MTSWRSGSGRSGCPAATRPHRPDARSTTTARCPGTATGSSRTGPRTLPGPRSPPAVGRCSGADLVAAAQVAPALPAGARLLVAEPLTGLAAVLGALLVPLATGVTAVLCRHLDLALLPSRVAQEGLVAAVGPDTAGTVPMGAARGRRTARMT